MIRSSTGLAFASAGGPSVPPSIPALSGPHAPGLLQSTDSAGFANASIAICAGGLAVACALLSGVRQRVRNRSRVIVNVRRVNDSGIPQLPRWRQTPGAKYRYFWANDKEDYIPEFGLGKIENPDRKIYAGMLISKGTALGPEGYRTRLEAGGFSGDSSEATTKASPLQGALLLDCDGTIVETERDGHRVAFNQAFAEKGYDFEWGVELYGELLTTGGGKERMVRYFTDYNPDAWQQEDPPTKDHPEIVALHKLKTDLFMDIVRSGSLPLREGIRDLIDEANDRGWKIAVCSTSNVEAVTTVIKTLLPDLASKIRIFAGDMVTKKKPDPEIYRMASQELGIAPMKCIVVEDAAIGVQAAKAAGMKVIVTKSIYSMDEDFDDADLIVDSAEEVDFEIDVLQMMPVMQDM